MRLIRACGAGSSLCPELCSAPASQIPDCSSSYPSRGAFPEHLPGLPRPWLWAEPGLWGSREGMLSPLLPVPAARWVLKRLRGNEWLRFSGWTARFYIPRAGWPRSFDPPDRSVSWGWGRIAGILHKLGCLEQSWHVSGGKIALLLLGFEADVRYLWYETENGGSLLVFAQKRDYRSTSQSTCFFYCWDAFLISI